MLQDSIWPYVLEVPPYVLIRVLSSRGGLSDTLTFLRRTKNTPPAMSSGPVAVYTWIRLDEPCGV